MLARILVKGKVQGVGFRNFVRITAKYSNINGLVRNLQDGAVEIFAEGSESDINKMVNIFKTNIGINVPVRVDEITIFPEGTDNYAPAWKDYRGKFLIDARHGE
ncbi:MAG: acylphosphatase [Candidatus Micrarchaeales archaeon]